MLTRTLLIAALVFLLISGAGCGGLETEDDAVYELNLAHFFPAVHPAETELVQGWAAAVEEATGGRVVITSYHGETLLKAAEVYDGVVSGIADIGLSCFAYTRGRFPILEAFELPGIVYESSYAASMTAWEGIKELDPAEVADTKLMFVIATGPGDLFTTTPVRSLEDLQGMKIRATGLSAETIKALGGIPEAMPQSDAYEALARGLVQGNLSPVEVLQGWNHAEVTEYLTLTPFLYNTLFFVTMNLNSWNSLPPNLQQIIEMVNESFHAEVASGLWDRQNEGALQWALTETGQELITLSAEETARWMELVQPFQDDFITRMNEQGLPGEEIMKTVLRLAEQHGR